MKKIIFVVLIVGLYLTGCAGVKSSSILRQDTLNEKAGYDAVAILRLRLIDETNTFDKLGNLSLWENYTGSTSKENRMAQLILGTEGRWETDEHSKYLEKTVFMETISGRHTIQSLSFSYDTVDGSMKRTTHTITMPIKREYTIPENSIAFLGELEIVNKEGGVFDHRFLYDEKKKLFTIKAFSKLFPEIFDQCKGNITIIVPEHSSD